MLEAKVCLGIAPSLVVASLTHRIKRLFRKTYPFSNLKNNTKIYKENFILAFHVNDYVSVESHETSFGLSYLVTSFCIPSSYTSTTRSSSNSFRALLIELMPQGAAISVDTSLNWLNRCDHFDSVPTS